MSVKIQGLIAYRLYQIESCRQRYERTLREILAKLKVKHLEKIIRKSKVKTLEGKAKRASVALSAIDEKKSAMRLLTACPFGRHFQSLLWLSRKT